MPRDTRVDTIIANVHTTNRTAAQELRDASPKSLAYVSTLSCRGILAIAAVIDIAVALILGHYRHDPNCQSVGLRHVSGHEVNAGLLKTEKENRSAANFPVNQFDVANDYSRNRN
jgi:hypothetical protein